MSWNFTHFQTDSIQLALAPTVSTLGLIATQSALNTPLLSATFVGAVEAQSSFQLNMHDLEFHRSWFLNEVVDFRAFGSVRWAQIDQQFDQFYTYSLLGLPPVHGTINFPTEMNAGGLRLGAQFQCHWAGGFRMFGRGSYSLLLADFDTQRREADTLNGLITDVPRKLTQVVTVLEASAGLAWSRGPWEVAAGYEMSDWFNMVAAGQTGQKLLMDGCFIRLAYSY